MPFVENFHEFRERMNCPFVEARGRFMFANGGLSNRFTHSDPPTDPTELLGRKREFARVQLEAAEKEFANTKRAFGEQASLAARYPNLPGAPSNAPQILRDLRKVAVVRRVALARIEAELAEMPAAIAIRRRDEIERERQEQHRRLRDEIGAINLDAPEDD